MSLGDVATAIAREASVRFGVLPDVSDFPNVPGLGVRVREADEREEAAVDPAGDPAPDAHFGTGDPLKDDAHGCC